jgi:hypothetical protein
LLLEKCICVDLEFIKLLSLYVVNFDELILELKCLVKIILLKSFTVSVEIILECLLLLLEFGSSGLSEYFGLHEHLFIVTGDSIDVFNSNICEVAGWWFFDESINSGA